MKRTKKVTALLLCLTMVLVFGLTGCGGSGDSGGSGESGEVYTFKIANLAADTDPLNVSYRYFKEQLEKASDGRIKVEIYSNKAISNSDEEQAEMIRSNMIQMTTCPTYIMAAMHEDLKRMYIFDIPYMFRTAEDIYAFGDSETFTELRTQLLEKTGNIKAYAPFGIGWVKIMTGKDAIKSPADLKGLKIRTTTSQFYMGVASSLGATPTPIAYGEAYTALQQKTVDGIMTSTSLLASDRFYEVQKSMACIDPYQITHLPLISNSWYEDLPEDLKTIFDTCMDDYIVYVRDLEEKAEIESKVTIADAGVNVCEYDEATKQQFIDACLPLWDKLADIVGGKDFINEVDAFLEESRE